MPSTASSIPKSADDAEDTESASACDAAPEVCTDCGGRGRRRPELPPGGGAGGGGGRDAIFRPARRCGWQNQAKQAKKFSNVLFLVPSHFQHECCYQMPWYRTSTLEYRCHFQVREYHGIAYRCWLGYVSRVAKVEEREEARAAQTRGYHRCRELSARSHFHFAGLQRIF